MFSSWFSSKEQSTNYQLSIEGKVVPKEDIFNNMKYYFEHKLFRQIPSNFLNKYSHFPPEDGDRKFYEEVLTSKQIFSIEALKLSEDQRRAVGCMVGLSIGDALGASTQFQDYDKNRQYWIKDDFSDLQRCIQKRILHERHGEIGIWTDDCSMANSMGYSLLMNNFDFNPVHIRYMFNLWLKHGLGNGGRSMSIGLGGNISLSTCQFMSSQNSYTKQDKNFNSGNGSLMRLAPVPIAYHCDEKDAMKYSGLQSRTTHDGDQAEQCCKLMALLLVRLMNRETDEWRSVLDKALSQFTSHKGSVMCMARSQKETEEVYAEGQKKYGKIFKSNNPSLDDRNWNWRSPDFTYSQFRAKRQPGYIGSYCMDALAMALHIIWQKNSFKECVLWSINMGGDCDTVGAIVGQLAGAIYGYNEEMHKLYSGMQDFTKNRFEVFLLGLKLGKHK